MSLQNDYRKMEILKHIPVKLDLDEIKKELHMKEGGEWGNVKALVDEAYPFIRARAVYRRCYIELKDENAIMIDGIRLTSRVLRKHTDGVELVFPYAVTIGSELEEKARGCKDILKQYYLDMVGNIALISARKYLEDQLRTRYALGCISYMSPGSLKDWRLDEQRPLFTILGVVEASIGVSLTKSLLMIPKKSLSGIYFPTEIPFYSCQLCPRKNCASRKAKYNERLAMEHGIQE
jgi:hypothetical protein